MIIGGAEDKLGKRGILKEFVAASGGRDATRRRDCQGGKTRKNVRNSYPSGRDS